MVIIMKKAVDIIRKNTMLIVLVLVVLFFAAMTKGQMVSAANFTALISQNAYVFILATGMLMCMLTGGNIDLSVGSVVCFIGAVGGTMMVTKGWPVPLSVLLMVVVGLIYGIVLGYLIAYLNIPPWIATLAGMLALRGWGVAIMKGLTISPLPDSFVKMFNGSVPDIFGNEEINITCILVGAIICVLFILLQLKSRADRSKKGYEIESMISMIVKIILTCAVFMLFAVKMAQKNGIPFALIWVAVICLIYNFITSKTTIGRYFYTIGGNEAATRLSGIDTKKIYFLAYVNMAFLSTIAAMMTMARNTSATPTAGTNFEMDAISACVVGGVSAYGGAGTVFGMVIGATLIGVINLGMSVMGIDANYQKVVKGLVLLFAVVFDLLNKKDSRA